MIVKVVEKMKRSYLANPLLRDFTQSLGFNTFIFDDPDTFGPEIKLRDKNKNGEIDAILLYKNVICIVGINRGKKEKVESEYRKFFEKLDKTEKVENLKLELEITAKSEKKIDSKIQAAKESLNEVQEHIKNIGKEYDLILKKIFFCPFCRLDNEKINKLHEKGEIILYKDIYEYFEEVLDRLNKDFLFYDFMYYLKIGKVDLEKKSPAKIKKTRKIYSLPC